MSPRHHPRKNFGLRLALCLVASICSPRPVHALDIPMKKALAEDVLDSKTCFATLRHNRLLVGYEMLALYVSKGGRLTALNAVGQFDIGDRRNRTYAGDGIRVEISPFSSRKFGNDDVHKIIEKAHALIVEDGKRRRLRIDVVLDCSP